MKNRMTLCVGLVGLLLASCGANDASPSSAPPAESSAATVNAPSSSTASTTAAPATSAAATTTVAPGPPVYDPQRIGNALDLASFVLTITVDNTNSGQLSQNITSIGYTKERVLAGVLTAQLVGQEDFGNFYRTMPPTAGWTVAHIGHITPHLEPTLGQARSQRHRGWTATARHHTAPLRMTSMAGGTPARHKRGTHTHCSAARPGYSPTKHPTSSMRWARAACIRYLWSRWVQLRERSTAIIKVLKSVAAILADPPNRTRISEVASFLVDSGKVVPGLATDDDGRWRSWWWPLPSIGDRDQIASLLDSRAGTIDAISDDGPDEHPDSVGAYAAAAQGGSSRVVDDRAVGQRRRRAEHDRSDRRRLGGP